MANRESGFNFRSRILRFTYRRTFTGRLAADGTFKIFSVDRELSCFVFVHGSGSSLPANWMSAEFTIDGESSSRLDH
jgi:hypothetical protein